MTTIHHRTCHICEANCGVLVELEGRTVKSIKGNPDHVLSRGHICPKATALADLQDDPDRLRRPVKRTEDGWQELDWETAFREIAQKVVALESAGARAAFYRGNPGAHDYALSTQSGYLQRAVGARGTFSASTLDQIPHHYAQYQMYGHVSLAAVPDIDRSQLIVIVGGNPMASNGSLWTVPDFRNRVKAMQARGGRLVVIDPRRTETAKIADAWHPVKPGTDTALLVGILQCVLAPGDALRAGLADLVDDSWAQVKPAIDGFDLAELAAHCGIPAATIRAIAAELASGKPAAIYGRMGVSVCEFGTLNQWLIQLINLATGNLDREGGTMFPQPLLDLVGQVGKGNIKTVETARCGNIRQPLLDLNNVKPDSLDGHCQVHDIAGEAQSIMLQQFRVVFHFFQERQCRHIDCSDQDEESCYGNSDLCPQALQLHAVSHLCNIIARLPDTGTPPFCSVGQRLIGKTNLAVNSDE